MANNIQVSLSFTADASKAKAELQSLQKSLQQLSMGSASTQKGLPLTQDILKAQEAARELSIALKNSTNVDTGKLNLTQFQTQMRAMGGDLEKYRIQMSALGKEGQQAFLGLTKQIMQADVAIKGSSKLMNDLWITLKNTAKWQLSSSAMKSFMGAIQSAFHYAEDLNKSLNQIQIVTNKSSADMANFAIQANKAAKELSTTTTAYTDASLIYYQQGLGDEQVKERTDITIKAANAAGTSAEKMSDYLTAVWNSYKVGSDQLEHFVDVMAALGAGTATSLEEISTAMEKVASVGEATGVSFEQLSSIIATVSSVTRTSAESVGTSYKTILARMADLKLEGSIDEDGVTTTLGDVSSQLEQVGVHILDDKGELRDMGTVIEDLMAKWNDMNGATQQAVAIAVAGKRQYTQLLALMNNQDMYKNAMGMATDADGTLQQQADTYAQSWEAAQKRVQAAAEGIYDSLINDKFFISLNDGFANFLGFIEKIIDALGGFQGVLGLIGTALTSIFSQQMANSFSNLSQQIFSTSALARQQANEMKQAAVEQANILTTQIKSGQGGAFGKNEGVAIGNVETTRIKLFTQLQEQVKNISAEEQEMYKSRLDYNALLGESVVKGAQELDKAKEKVKILEEENAQLEIKKREAFAQTGIVGTKQSKMESDISQLIKPKAYADLSSIENLKKSFEDIKKASPEATQEINKLEQALARLEKNHKNNFDADKALESMANRIEKNNVVSASYEQELEKLSKTYGLTKEQVIQLANTMKDLEQSTDNLANASNAANEIHEEQIQNVKEFENQSASIEESLITSRNSFDSFGEGMMQSISGISQVTMGLGALKGAFAALNNEDMSTFDKVTSIMMSLSMAIPSLVGGFATLQQGFSAMTSSLAGFTSANFAAMAAEGMLTEKIGEETVVLGTNMTVKQAKENLEKTSLIQRFAIIAAQKLGLVAYAQENGQIVLNTANKSANTVVTWLLKVAQDALNGSILATIGLLGIFVAAIGVVVAIVWKIVEAFKAWKESTPEAQIKKLEETSKGFADAAKNAKDRVEELKNSLDSLKNFKDTFKELKEGTQEWTDALNDHNDEVLKLIEKYPSLQKGLTISETPEGKGTIFDIDETELDRAIQKQKNLQRTNELLSHYYANQATERKEELNRQSLQSGITNDEGLSRLYRSYTNAPTRKEAPKNTGIDVSGMDNLSQGQIYNQLKDQIANRFSELDPNLTEYEDVLRALGEKDQAALEAKLVDTSQKVYESFQKTQNGVLDVLTKSLLEQIASDKFITTDVEKILGKDAVKKYQDKYNEKIKETNTNRKATDEEKDKYLENAYGEDSGYKFKDAGYGQGDKGMSIVDKDGNTVQEGIQDKEIILSNINFELTEGAEEELQAKINDVVNNITKNTPEIRLNLSDEIKGQFVDMAYTMQEAFQNISTQSITDDEALKVSENVIAGWVDQVKKAGNDVSLLASSFKEINWSEGASEVLNYEETLKSLGATLDNVTKTALIAQANQAQQKAILAETAEYMRTYQNNAQKQAESMGLSEKALTNYRKELENTNKEIAKGGKVQEISNDGLYKSASAQKRVSSSLSALSKDWDKLYKSLTDANGKIDPFAEGFEEALDQIKGAMKGLVGADLSDDFFLDPEHLKDIERAINGDTDALSRLRAAAVDDIVMHLTYDFKESGEEAVLQDLQSKITNFQNFLDSNPLQMDASISDQSFTDLANTMNSLVEQGKMTASEFFGIWDGMSIAPEIEQVPMSEAAKEQAKADHTTHIESHGTHTVHFPDPENPGKLKSEDVEYTNIEDVTSMSKADWDALSGGTMPKVKMVAGQAVGTKKAPMSASAGASSRTSASAAGTGSGGKGSKGGGGGSSKGSKPSSSSKSSGGGSPSTSTNQPKTPKKAEPKTADPKIMRAEAERYLDISAALKRVKEYQDDLARSKEHLFGVNYINKLEEETAALKEEAKVLEEYNNQILLNNKRKEDGGWELNSKGQESDAAKLERITGIKIELDDNGSIKNRQAYADWFIQKQKDIEQGRVNDENAIEDSWYDTQVAAGGEASDAQQEEYEKSKTTSEEYWKKESDSVEEAQEALDKYIADNEKYIENQNRLEEILYETRSKNLEKITYKLEKRLELQENELKMLELQEKILNKDVLRNSPEIFSNLLQKATNATNQLALYEDAYNEIMNNPELNDDEKAEKINEIYSEMVDSAETLLDIQEQMGDLVSNMIEDWTEKLSKLTDQFDYLTGVLENVEKIYELTGQNLDTKTMSDLVDKQAKVTKDAFDSAYNTYITAKKAEDEARKIAEETGSEWFNEHTLDEWTAATQQAAADMQEAGIAYEEILQKQRDLEIDKSMKKLQNRLFGDLAEELGIPIDTIMDQIDHLSSLNDIYLTKTNQQYETQALIRKAMQDMDKTENLAAKNKLRLFQEQTKKLQEQNKLSKYDLEMQKARYQELLAEIALQEAQNTKSQVRLQRDSEGNFNYVYTADEDKIAESIDAYEKARNDTYNISLNAANEYGEKYLQTMQNWYDEYQEIAKDQELNETERDERLRELTQRTAESLIAIKEVATQAGIDLADKESEAYMSDMTNNAIAVNSFKKAAKTATREVGDSYSEFEELSKDVTNKVVDELDDVEGKSGDLAQAVAELNASSEDSFQKMSQNMAIWAGGAINQLDEVIGKYVELANQIKEAYRAQTGFSADIDYMARYQSSSTIADAYANLESRDAKQQGNSFYLQYGSNDVALLEDVNNEAQNMLDATSIMEVIGAAARREAKIQYFKAAYKRDLKTEFADNWQDTGEFLYQALSNIGAPADALKYAQSLSGKANLTDGMLKELWNKFNSASFDTGGYTGDFGSEGKIGILHEKELVLNQEDTNNVLKSVEIANTIVEKVMGENLRFSLNTALGNSIVKNNDQSQIVQQTVSIEASFPNVQDRNEIQLALENIVNTAAQYANRKSY